MWQQTTHAQWAKALTHLPRDPYIPFFPFWWLLTNVNVVITGRLTCTRVAMGLQLRSNMHFLMQALHITSQPKVCTGSNQQLAAYICMLAQLCWEISIISSTYVPLPTIVGLHHMNARTPLSGHTTVSGHLRVSRPSTYLVHRPPYAGGIFHPHRNHSAYDRLAHPGGPCHALGHGPMVGGH